MKRPNITPGGWMLAKSCHIKAAPDGLWMHFPEVITEDYATNVKPMICEVTPREFRRTEKESYSPDEGAEANARFIAAAPAKALEYGFAVDNAPTFEWEAFSEFLRMAHIALLSAGYTEEEEGL